MINRPKIQLLIIVLLTFLAYSNIFQNNFAIDDGDFIFNWPAIKSFDNIGKIVTVESVPEDHGGVYRPVKAVVMMVATKIFGFRPFGYHLFSISVHLANTVLVYLIVRELLRVLPRKAVPPSQSVSALTEIPSSAVPLSVSPAKQKIINRKSLILNQFLPFIVALLFGLHPIHTEAVTFILASFDTVGITFYLLAFWLYVKVHSSWFIGHSLSKTVLKIGSVLFAFLGFLTYELAVTLPAAIVIYDLTLGSYKLQVTSYKFVKKKFLVYWPYFLALFFYLYWRFFILHIVARGEYLPAGEASLGGSFYKTELVMILALAKYLGLLIWPLSLSIDHKILPGIYSVIYKAFVNTKTIESLTIFSPAIFSSLIILGSLAVVSIVCYRRWPIISFSLWWFLVTLLPVSFILPQSSIMAERYAYLASFGFVLILSYLGYLSYLRFLSYRRLVLLILVGVVAVYAIRTYVRNFDWKDTLTVWQKLANASPDNPVTNYTLAKIYAERQQENLAILYFKKALETYPDIAEVNFRLGKIYYSQGQIDEAEQFFVRAAKRDNARFFFMAQRELSKIAYIKSQKSQRSQGWLKYTLEDRVTFSYLSSWLVTKFERGVAFDDLDVDFSVEFYVDLKDPSESFENYISRQPDHFGTLTGAGLAQVPSVQHAYVKVWKDDEVDKLEFFLANKNTVVKILVYPSSSPKMADFDKVLGSITIN